MLIVCPSVKNEAMATEIFRLALTHVQLVRDVLSAQESNPYVESEFVRGWDEGELRNPILSELHPKLFLDSELFLIIDFSLDGAIRSIMTISRAALYRGV